MSSFNLSFPFNSNSFGENPFGNNLPTPAEFIEFLRSLGIDPDKVLPGGAANLTPESLQQMLTQATFVMNQSTGPINWQLVQHLVRQQAWGEGDLQISAAQAAGVKQNLQIADLWLDAVTEIAPVASQRKAWRRSDWADETLDTWKQIIEPVAANVERAFKETLTENLERLQNLDEFDLERIIEDPHFQMFKHMPQMHDLETFKAMLGQGDQLMSELSSAMFSINIGRALGELSHASLGSTDVGIPGGADPVTALVVPNVDAFAAGFEIPIEEVRQFLALRECAHARLFASVPWLKAEFLAAIRSYAAAISIDTEAIRQALETVDPMDQEALQEALTGKLFKPQPSEVQLNQLARLEWLLALIEGWVETVSFQAARAYLPYAPQLREIMRRRRVDGSPAEQVLTQLIGLQLRPVKARNAALLWEFLSEDGISQRDAYWSHPDIAPSATELDDPQNFKLNRQLRDAAEASIDDELSSLLDGTLGWAEGLNPDDDSAGDKQA